MCWQSGSDEMAPITFFWDFVSEPHFTEATQYVPELAGTDPMDLSTKHLAGQLPGFRLLFSFYIRRSRFPLRQLRRI